MCHIRRLGRPLYLSAIFSAIKLDSLLWSELLGQKLQRPPCLCFRPSISVISISGYFFDIHAGCAAVGVAIIIDISFLLNKSTTLSSHKKSNLSSEGCSLAHEKTGKATAYPFKIFISLISSFHT